MAATSKPSATSTAIPWETWATYAVLLAIASMVLWRLYGVATGWLKRLPDLPMHIPAVGRPLMVAAGVVVVLVVAAGWALRARAIRRTAADAAEYAVLPGYDFAPTAEALEAFARGLVSCRRRSRIGGWWDRPACAIRIRLTVTTDGRPVYLVRVPRAFADDLQRAYSAFPNLQLRPAADVNVRPWPEGRGVRVAAIELVPARNEAWPLAELDWDPLPAFAHVLDGVGEVEHVVVDVALLPLPPQERGAFRQQVLGDIQSADDWGRLLRKGGEGGRGSPAEVVERQLERAAAKAKVGDSQPLFRVQILARAASMGNRHRPWHLLRNVQGAFDQWIAENFLREAGFNLGFIRTVPRRWIEYRMRSGIFFGKKTITNREMRLLAPWGKACPDTVMRRVGLGLPVPEAAARKGKVICITDEGREVALTTTDASHHVQVLSPTGGGKSSLLCVWGLSDLAQGTAHVGVDLKGDTTRYLLERIPREHWDKVVVIDPGYPDAAVGLNVLECDDPGLHELVAEQTVAIFQRLYAGESWGPRMEYYLRSSVITLLAAGNGATLCDIPLLLTNEQARQRWTAKLDDPIMQMAWQQYDAMTEPQRNQACGPMLSRLLSVLQRPSVAHTLGQSKSTIDLEQLLDNGGMVLVNLRKGTLGEQTARLLGSFLIARTWQVIMGRAKRAMDERPPVTLVADEAQNMVAFFRTVGELLEEARSYGLGIVLAHHNTGQLKELEEAVDTNARTKVSFQSGSESEARKLAPNFRPLTARDLMSLVKRQVAVRMFAGGSTQPAFTGRTPDMPPSLGQEHAKALLEHAMERYGRPRDEVKAEIVRRWRIHQVEGEDHRFA